MVTSYIYMPHGMDDSVVQAAKSHFANEFGGFTVIDARGGWQSPDGQLITEATEVVEVAGMPNHVAERTANWLANRTDETEVMFQTVESEVGFASGDD
jgi:hypothetical protein